MYLSSSLYVCMLYNVYTYGILGYSPQLMKNYPWHFRSIIFTESETLTSDVDTSIEKNRFTCQAKVLNEAALNFLKNQEEVTMAAYQDKFIIKTFMEPNQTVSIRTEFTLPPTDFEDYIVESGMNWVSRQNILQIVFFFKQKMAIFFCMHNIYHHFSENAV